MSEEKSFDSICRLCTNTVTEDALEIFSQKGEKNRIAKKIRICLRVKVEKDDQLPKSICNECVEKLDNYYKYQESCLQTELVLHKCLAGEKLLNRSSGNGIVTENGKKNIESNFSSDSDLSLSENVDNNTDDDEDSDDYKGSGTENNNNSQHKSSLPKLGDPSPDDYVLMKEETFNLDPVKESNRGATSSILADYLIEFSNAKLLATQENEMKDKDLADNQKLRREILPPMWDVYEKTIVQQEQNPTVVGGEKDGTKRVTVTHRRYIINKGAFPCSLCGECFEFDQGKKRDDYSEEKAKLYDCQTCGKLFPRRNSWKRHQSTHEDIKPFVCRVCNKGFNRKEHLTRHLYSHSSVRPFSCTVCTKQFVRKEHLTRHQLCSPQCAVAPDTVLRPFCCDVCNQGFVRKEHLHRHRKKAHNLDPPDGDLEPKPFSCNICSKTFTRREHLKRHQLIHQREYTLTCTSTSETPNTLKQEYAFQNSEVTLFPSSFLPEVTFSEVPLEKSSILRNSFSAESHTLIPEDTSVVEINNGGDYFTAVDVKQEIMEVDEDHENHDLVSDEPLPPIPVLEMTPSDDIQQPQQHVDVTKSNTFCNVCFKNFSRRSHLLRHMKRIHRMQLPPMSRRRHKTGDENGNMPDVDYSQKFPCSQCGRMFSRKSHLERHEKIHQLAKEGYGQRYECVTCGESFTQSKLLDKHMEVHGNTLNSNFVWM